MWRIWMRMEPTISTAWPPRCGPRTWEHPGGDSEDDVKAVYTGAVQMEAVGEDQFGADYALIHEPGGLSYCKHISFFITDGEVSAIQVEDLVDGRLLS